jgi:hypothetical protein
VALYQLVNLHQLVDSCHQLVEMCHQLVDSCHQLVEMCHQLVDSCHQAVLYRLVVQHLEDFKATGLAQNREVKGQSMLMCLEVRKQTVNNR